MLRTKQVGKYTVTQFGTLASVRARYFNEEANKLRHITPEGETPSDDDEIYNLWLDDWVSLASSVQPKITIAEYESIDVNLMKELSDAISEVNATGTEDAEPHPATSDKAKKKRYSKT